MIVDGSDAPGVVVAGSGQEYGLVTLGTLSGVLDETARLSFVATGMTHEHLVGLVSELADQVRLLAGEVYQLSRGAMYKRVAVNHGDD